jgi:hypothetical protein
MRVVEKEFDMDLIMESFKPLEELEKITMFETSKKIGVRPHITKKLEWLKELIEMLINMDKYHNKSTPTSVYEDSYAIGGMLDNISLGKLPRKKDMIRCNKMLKGLKCLYGFDIDWRGDIIDCDMYTKYTLNKESKIT